MSNAIKSQGTLLEIDDGGSPTSWIEIGEVNTISGVGSGEAADIDVTHLRSTGKEYLVGLPDGGNVTLEGNLVPSDTGQVELRDSRDTQTVRGFRLTLANTAATKIRFDGFVKSFEVGAVVDDKIPFTASIRVTGKENWI